MVTYGFVKKLALSFDEAEKKVTEELKKDGFGVLTRIDMKEKFREKLDVDFRNYVILGACNPPLALKSLTAEENIGLLLPCNVIVYEEEAGSGTKVGIIKPTSAMGMVENDALRDTALDVEAKLKKVFDALTS